MFPVKEQGNIYLTRSLITNCVLILVLLPCPCVKKEGSQDSTFSWMRYQPWAELGAPAITLTWFLKCGWVTKSSVQLPCQFYLEHYASSRSVELGYLSFTIFTIIDLSSKVTFIQAILFIRATLQWLSFRLSCNSEHLISPCPHPCVPFVIKHYIITSSWDEQESQDCRTPYT